MNLADPVGPGFEIDDAGILSGEVEPDRNHAAGLSAQKLSSACGVAGRIG